MSNKRRISRDGMLIVGDPMDAAILSQQSVNFDGGIGMKIVKRSSNLIKAMFLGLILVLAVPTVSFAQGRGRGWGRGRDRHVNKKADKFINGHDARDGRWDGRGPNRARGTTIGDIFRNRRIRRDNRDDNFIYRNRRVDRDGDGDFDRNDVRIGHQQNRSERLQRRAARRHGLQ